VAAIKDRNAGSNPDTLNDLIETIVRDVRRVRAAKQTIAAAPR